MATVTNDLECHNSTITPQILGFMYFFIFEFIYHKEVYKGANGRAKFPNALEPIQFFVDVATEEYQYCFGADDKTPAADLAEKKQFILQFFKFVYDTCIIYKYNILIAAMFLKPIAECSHI
jgi:hypothetical protein